MTCQGRADTQGRMWQWCSPPSTDEARWRGSKRNKSGPDAKTSIQLQRRCTVGIQLCCLGPTPQQIVCSVICHQRAEHVKSTKIMSMGHHHWSFNKSLSTVEQNAILSCTDRHFATYTHICKHTLLHSCRVSCFVCFYSRCSQRSPWATSPALFIL